MGGALQANRDEAVRIDFSILDRLEEPADPEERALAIRFCRINDKRNPDTGLPEPDRAKSKRQWDALPEFPMEKWLWMWNHGRAEWDPRFKRRKSRARDG